MLLVSAANPITNLGRFLVLDIVFSMSMLFSNSRGAGAFQSFFNFLSEQDFGRQSETAATDIKISTGSDD